MDEAQAGQGLGEEGQHEHQPGVLPAPQGGVAAFRHDGGGNAAQPVQTGSDQRVRQVRKPVVQAAGPFQHRVDEAVQHRRRMAQVAGVIHRLAHEETGSDQGVADRAGAGTAGGADEDGAH